MDRKINYLGALVLIICLLATGCTKTVNSHPLAFPLVNVVNTKSVYETTYVYPTSIDQAYKPGVLINEWSSNDDDKIVGHKAGEPLGITIHNGEDSAQVFNISLLDTGAWSERHKMDYPAAPDGFDTYVSLNATQVILNPGELKAIPFSIDIPEGTILPRNFEFRIAVDIASEAKPGANLLTGGQVRIFMSADGKFDAP